MPAAVAPLVVFLVEEDAPASSPRAEMRNMLDTMAQRFVYIHTHTHTRTHKTFTHEADARTETHACTHTHTRMRTCIYTRVRSHTCTRYIPIIAMTGIKFLVFENRCRLDVMLPFLHPHNNEMTIMRCCPIRHVQPPHLPLPPHTATASASAAFLLDGCGVTEFQYTCQVPS